MRFARAGLPPDGGEWALGGYLGISSQITNLVAIPLSSQVWQLTHLRQNLKTIASLLR